MILDNLYAYYEQKTREGSPEMPQRYWGIEKVAWEFRIDKDGRLVSVLPYSSADGKVKSKPMLVPEHATRSSGIKPFFLCDKSAYLLGRDSKRGAQMLEKSLALHSDILSGIDDPAARAVLAFLSCQSGSERISDAVLEELDKGGYIVFRFLPDGEMVHERDCVRQAWMRWNTLECGSADAARCGVTGILDVPATLFPLVSGVPGAQSSGASLVSFNQDSFCSYGKSAKHQALNASMSQTAAFGIGTALKYLIQSPEHHMSLGGSQVLFWTESAEPEDESILWLMLNIDEAERRAVEDERLREEIRGKLEGIKRGRRTLPFSRDTRYFVLGLAPNVSRLSVRFFEVGTLGELEEALHAFLSDVDMVSPDGNGALDPKSVRFYVNQTAPFGKADNVPDVLLSSVTDAMLKNRPFPESFFHLLLARTRADKGRQGTGDRKYDVMAYRAAAMKACLVRKSLKDRRSLAVKLNKDNNDLGYMLGRLFAVLEKAQTEAVPGANTTIRDRYIGSASSTPSRVFPQLLKMAQHHISKAEYGRVSDRRIQEIMEGIDEFPPTLTYDEQGRFFIGYYQQKASFWASVDDVGDVACLGE